MAVKSDLDVREISKYELSDLKLFQFHLLMFHEEVPSIIKYATAVPWIG